MSIGLLILVGYLVMLTVISLAIFSACVVSGRMTELEERRASRKRVQKISINASMRCNAGSMLQRQPVRL
ncbi:MAG: hypothetical protein U0350_44585 [Caldilineaceae bacterium]